MTDPNAPNGGDDLFSDAAAEIKAMAKYLSSLPGELKTVELREFR